MKLNPIISFAALLLGASAILHIIMPLIHGTYESTIPIAAFGVIYLVLSLFLLKQKRWALYASAIMTTIGMSLASMVYLQTADHFPLDLPFIIVDIIIVPIFWFFIITKKPILAFKN